MAGSESANLTSVAFKNTQPNMKEELLDIDAILSTTAACLSYSPPDLEKAKTTLNQARKKLLNLLAGLDDSGLN